MPLYFLLLPFLSSLLFTGTNITLKMSTPWCLWSGVAVVVCPDDVTGQLPMRRNFSSATKGEHLRSETVPRGWTVPRQRWFKLNCSPVFLVQCLRNAYIAESHLGTLLSASKGFRSLQHGISQNFISEGAQNGEHMEQQAGHEHFHIFQ